MAKILDIVAQESKRCVRLRATIALIKADVALLAAVPERRQQASDLLRKYEAELAALHTDR